MSSPLWTRACPSRIARNHPARTGNACERLPAEVVLPLAVVVPVDRPAVHLVEPEAQVGARPGPAEPHRDRRDNAAHHGGRVEIEERAVEEQRVDHLVGAAVVRPEGGDAARRWSGR